MPMTGNVRSWDAAATDPTTVGEVAEAVAFFRAHLGDAWRGWSIGAPLATRFHTAFQGGLREWVRLYRLARSLDGVRNLGRLLQGGVGS